LLIEESTLPPQRIVCLSEEPTEILYHLGEQDRIVGITAYTVRPPQAPREKPVISHFIEADLDGIMALEPDLAIAFSDLQADLAAELIRRGLTVLTLNQRCVADILEAILLIAAVVGRTEDGQRYIADLTEHVAAVRQKGSALPVRPRVYFEEWPKPTITAIGWVAELVEIAGGYYVFPELRGGIRAQDRALADPGEVLRRKPDLMLASWCGAKFKSRTVLKRPGWAEADFVRAGRLVEIPSEIILQPGPAALTDGLDALHTAIAEVATALDH
jgi:iron complex transport system substrate-binding protein